MKRIVVLGAILSLIFSAGYSQASDTPSESPENFIRRLYNEYLTDFQKNKYWLDDENKLSQYFDPTLTMLFLRNEECKEKTHELCNLNFDPIIDAQDFDENQPVSIDIAKVDDKIPVHVKVYITNISSRTIIYELKETEHGWRISNINYSENGSLVELLSQKVDE